MLSRWLKRWTRRRDAGAPAEEIHPETTAPLSAALRAEYAALHRRYLQLLLGEKGAGASLSVPEKLVRQVVEQQLRNSEARRAAVPRLPTVIPLLLKQLRDPNASARDYIAIIRQDPVVASAVLTFANSAYFNPYRKQIDNFEQAVATLGINGLRMVLSTAVLQPIVRGRGDSLAQRVWDQSFICAICCQQLAGQTRLDPFKAYLLGLLCNIGVVTIYNQVQQQGAQHLQGATPSADLLLQLIAQWAQPLAYWIAQDWQLPEEIVRALGAPNDQGGEQGLAGVLLRASHFAEAYALEHAGQMDRKAVQRLADTAGLPADILAQLDAVLPDLLGRKGQ
jgi:HD-like signal output (HDOD) protein